MAIHRRKRKQLQLSRFRDIEDIPLNLWKDAISAIVLLGYEVYADEEKIVFTLGNDDVVKDVVEVFEVKEDK